MTLSAAFAKHENYPYLPFLLFHIYQNRYVPNLFLPYRRGASIKNHESRNLFTLSNNLHPQGYLSSEENLSILKR